MATSVFCIVPTENQAASIVRSLLASGFTDSDISLLYPDRGGSRDLGHVASSKAPEGATIGASTGGVVGGVVGLLAGIGLLAIPGVGPFVAAGPIMAALSGLAVGATAGGIGGALIGLGIPEYEAKRYEGKLSAGNVLLSVHADSGEEVKKAKDIFKEGQAEDISTSTEVAAPSPRR
jgi:hypothetical protein